MQKDGPDKSVADKVGLTTPSLPASGRVGFQWPWGIIALLIMALAWVGVYLIWNGFVFLLQ